MSSPCSSSRKGKKALASARKGTTNLSHPKRSRKQTSRLTETERRSETHTLRDYLAVRKLDCEPKVSLEISLAGFPGTRMRAGRPVLPQSCAYHSPEPIFSFPPSEACANFVLLSARRH